MRRDDRLGGSVLVRTLAARRRGRRVPSRNRGNYEWGIRSNSFNNSLDQVETGRRVANNTLPSLSPIPPTKCRLALRSTYYNAASELRRRNSGLTHSTRVYPSAVVKNWLVNNVWQCMTYSDEVTEIRILTDWRSDHLTFLSLFFLYYLFIKKGNRRRRSGRRERFSLAIF